MNAVESLRYFIPEICLLLGSLFLLLTNSESEKKVTGFVSLLTAMTALTLSRPPHSSTTLFFDCFSLDAATHYARILILTVTTLTFFSSLGTRAMPRKHLSEYFSLFLMMAFALSLMAASNNFLILFLSIEFVSMISYLMTGMLKRDSAAKEAAIKYLLYGSVCSAIMLYGISMIYGLAGSLQFTDVARALSTGQFNPMGVTALMFILVGLGFKISIAPFHQWAPDVYHAAPTPVAGFLTVAPKAVGFIVLFRLMLGVFGNFSGAWINTFTILALLTMTLGNLTAIAQSNIKRLLAYSSIAQAGYILIGLIAFHPLGSAAVFIYLAAYAFTNLGAFTAISAVSNQTNSEDLTAYSGLAKRSPFTAACLTVFLLSLAGLPPLAGFIGKFFIFSAAINQRLVIIAIVTALNSAVAAFYYFKIVRAMYLSNPRDDQADIALPVALKAALGVNLLAVIALGIMPHPLLNFAHYVTAYLF